MPMISVIVPAYNAQATIEKTISDVLNQTYQNYELIIVDDGSSDKTPDICEEMKSKDSRIHVIHQPNGGPSNARNNGVKEAQGSYISFIDSDDRIDPNLLEYLIRAIKETKADIACGRIDRVREEYNLIYSKEEYRKEVFDQREALSEMATGKKLTVGPCCRLVRKELQSAYPFIEGAYYEDLSNTYKLYLMSSKTVFVDIPLYHYVMRGGSTTGKKTMTEKLCQDYEQAITMCSNSILAKYPNLKQDVAVLIARDYMSLYLCINRCEIKTEYLQQLEKDLCKWMNQNWRIAAMNPKAPLNVRLRLLLFGVSPSLYRKAYYSGIKIKGKSIG